MEIQRQKQILLHMPKMSKESKGETMKLADLITRDLENKGYTVDKLLNNKFFDIYAERGDQKICVDTSETFQTPNLLEKIKLLLFNKTDTDIRRLVFEAERLHAQPILASYRFTPKLKYAVVYHLIN